MGNEPTCCQIGKWFHLTKQQSDGAKLSGHDPGTEQPGDNARWWFSEMFIFLWWGTFPFLVLCVLWGTLRFCPTPLASEPDETSHLERLFVWDIWEYLEATCCPNLTIIKVVWDFNLWKRVETFNLRIWIDPAFFT